MRQIIMKRQAGKTSKLIRLSAELEIPIVVANYDRRENIKSRAADMRLKIPEPICFPRVVDGTYRGTRFDSCLIDDPDYVVQYVLGTNAHIHHVTAITLTKEESIFTKIRNFFKREEIPWA